jgi:hypothetical protein
MTEQCSLMNDSGPCTRPAVNTITDIYDYGPRRVCQEHYDKRQEELRDAIDPDGVGGILKELTTAPEQDDTEPRS